MAINLRKTLGQDRGLVFLISALVSFVILLALNFGYVAQQSGYDKEYASLSGELRVLSQRIAKNAEVSVTRAAAFPQLKDARDQFAQTLSLLKNGNPLTGLPPTPDTVTPSLAVVETQWQRYSANADIILNDEELVKASTEFVKTINEVSPKLTNATEALLDSLTAEQAMAQRGNITVAGRLVALSQQIATHVNRLFQGARGSEAAAQAADLLRRDTAAFVTALEGLRSGNQVLKIARVENTEARAQLNEITELFSSIAQLDLLILEKFPDLFRVQDAAQGVFEDSDTLFQDTTSLVSAYADLEDTRIISAGTGYVLGVIALLLLIALGYTLRSDAAERAAKAEQQNRKNEEAIITLLNELGGLQDGNLTVKATVSEAFTGAIADAVNSAIDSLRSLVRGINDTTLQVASATNKTQATAVHLSEASDEQMSRMAEASTAVNQMAVSIQEVAANASESAQVAQTSVQIANQGAQAVQNTIQGMDRIREQIQETSKRIKRLGESSQEIGDIVDIISDIADQTNILALNAAIQAAMAGDAGVGFAVVADEVQRLAERSINATMQIDALVKTIQSDASEAIGAMEQSTSNVVTGAKVAHDADEALKEIEKVSHHLAELVQNISHSTRQQSATAANISDTMNVVREIAAQTSVGSNEVAASVGNLANLANDLRKSVAGFKLPA